MQPHIRPMILACTLLTLLIAAGAQASMAASASTSGLALWYDMTETGGILADESGNGNDGIVNGAMYDLLPSGSGSREFDGYNDDVLCGDYPELDPANGMTLEVLFRPGHTGGLQTLIGKSWSAATGGRLHALGQQWRHPAPDL